LFSNQCNLDNGGGYHCHQVKIVTGSISGVITVCAEHYGFGYLHGVYQQAYDTGTLHYSKITK
jgi:hypothetical protein